jgi:hypothetical protein
VTLPLSKTLDPADFDQLREELAIVDRCFTDEREQHPMRRWEYALALRAYRQWLQRDYETCGHANRTHGGRLADVGGAGSPWSRILGEEAGGAHVTIIDPAYAPGPKTLAQYIRYGSLASAVFCLSVLEHVDDLDEFCYHLSCLVAPGGLLFLTMDYCDSRGAAPADTYHFHWMRKRIFNGITIRDLADIFTDRDFVLLGAQDYADHGPQVYNYTFASLALRKRL